MGNKTNDKSQLIKAENIFVSPIRSIRSDLSDPSVDFILCIADDRHMIPGNDHVIVLSFMDTEEEKHSQRFTEAHAKQIVDFLIRPDARKDLFVCCDAGESRSPAIAASIFRVLGISDQWIWDSPEYHPNKLVYREMNKALEQMKVFEVKNSPGISTGFFCSEVYCSKAGFAIYLVHTADFSRVYLSDESCEKIVAIPDPGMRHVTDIMSLFEQGNHVMVSENSNSFFSLIYETKEYVKNLENDPFAHQVDFKVAKNKLIFRRESDEFFQYIWEASGMGDYCVKSINWFKKGTLDKLLHTYNSFPNGVFSFGDDIVEELVRFAANSSDELLMKQLRLYQGIATKEECEILSGIYGKRILPPLSEQFDRDYVVYLSNLRDYDLLYYSGFDFQNGASLALVKKSQCVVVINPHRKRIIDTKESKQQTLTFEDFLKLYEK